MSDFVTPEKDPIVALIALTDLLEDLGLKSCTSDKFWISADAEERIKKLIR